MAALVAAKFNIDPILVLKSNFTHWAIRIAAYRYVIEREEKAAAKQRAAQQSKQRSRFY